MNLYNIYTYVYLYNYLHFLYFKISIFIVYTIIFSLYFFFLKKKRSLIVILSIFILLLIFIIMRTIVKHKTLDIDNFGAIFDYFKVTYIKVAYFYYFVEMSSYVNYPVDIFCILIYGTTLIISVICIMINLKKNVIYNNLTVLFYFIFNLVIYNITNTESIMMFFLLYEFLLLPSVVLVFISSSNKRSIYTSLYFLFWTQLGSFLVFLGLFYLYSRHYIYNFNDLTNKITFLTKNEYFYVSILLFFGFGIKIPVWPFHFWLTKTHVEANTGFSIFLSGILVKIALFGIYKFNILFNHNYNFLFLYFIIFSILDVGFKISFQTDYKKIIAYATIFEMNYIMINFFIPSCESYTLAMYFVLFHSCISAIFFFLVDCLYKNFNTRIVNSINSIQNTSKNLSILVFASLMFFLGFPLTIKFNIEIIIFSKIFNYNFIIFIFFLTATFLFNFFFTKFFFKLYFGLPSNNLKIIDLSKFEIFIFMFLFLIIFLLNFL